MNKLSYELETTQKRITSNLKLTTGLSISSICCLSLFYRLCVNKKDSHYILSAFGVGFSSSIAAGLFLGDFLAERKNLQKLVHNNQQNEFFCDAFAVHLGSTPLRKR